MMIALIGIGGQVGSRLLAELLRRGHEVTGIARDTGGVAARPRLLLKNADATRTAQLAPLLAGHDAVISAMIFATSDAAALIAALKQADVPGGWWSAAPAAWSSCRASARAASGSAASERLLTEANGRSWISTEDFAVAMVDELEAPKHSAALHHRLLTAAGRLRHVPPTRTTRT